MTQNDEDLTSLDLYSRGGKERKRFDTYNSSKEKLSSRIPCKFKELRLLGTVIVFNKKNFPNKLKNKVIIWVKRKKLFFVWNIYYFPKKLTF